MIVGYVLVGSIAGMIAAACALLFGASFWFALGIYAFVGSAALLLLSVVQALAGRHSEPENEEACASHFDETGKLFAGKSQVSQLGAVVETSMRILAVDDDPFILELIPMIAAKEGYSQVTPVSSGEQALTLLTNNDAVFDCLLFDVHMPNMDGIELCRRVRQIPQYRNTPIIMLTAMRDVTNMGDAYRAGATDYATKPFDIDDLGTRLRLAQETVQAGPVRQKETEHHRSPEHSYSFELPEVRPLKGLESPVDRRVLSNYLTQLPVKELANIQVFAVSIDRVEAVHIRSSSQQFLSLLEDLVAAAADCFGADRIVMAYTSNATLLIAADSPAPLLGIRIEDDIEKWIQGSISKYSTDDEQSIGVSVGGPVQPQSPKAARARMVTDRVIVLAENRALDKQGRSVGGFFERH